VAGWWAWRPFFRLGGRTADTGGYVYSLRVPVYIRGKTAVSRRRGLKLVTAGRRDVLRPDDQFFGCWSGDRRMSGVAYCSVFRYGESYSAVITVAVT